MKTTKFLLLAFSLLIFAGCGKPEQTSPRNSTLPPVIVKTVTAGPAEQKVFQEIVGSVEAKLRAVMEAKTSGRIELFPVRLGQAVKKGALLAQLDAREIQARLDQASATREQSRSDLKRLTALLQQQALTQAEFDAAEARFRVADAALREAEILFGYTKIVAPFDGVIVRTMADVGDLAAPGKPLLELEDPAAHRFVVHVPDTQISAIRPGMDLPIQLGHQEITGKVAEIAPAGDPVSRTSRVELDLPASDLRSGSFGRLLVPTGDRSMLMVPADALVTRGQLETIFVVSSNRAELRLVKTGKRFEKSVEILSGLSPGEQIVVENAGTLRDGQEVASL